MFNNISIIFICLAFLAEIIGTIGGFGSSVYFVPIGNFYFDFHTVLGMTAVFHVASNLSKIILFKKGLNKRIMLYMGIPSVVFVVLGGYLSKYFDGAVLALFLAVFLILLSTVFLIWKKIKIQDSNRNATIGGILSGFASGLLGTGGAIRGLTMASFKMKKDQFIATSAFIDFLIDSSRTAVYAHNGYITKEVLIYIPFLLVVGFLGTFVGKKILAFISEERFRTISLLFILIIGIVTLAHQLS